MLSSAVGEFPARPQELQACKGSFDCDFAEDDNVVRARKCESELRATLGMTKTKWKITRARCVAGDRARNTSEVVGVPWWRAG